MFLEVQSMTAYNTFTVQQDRVTMNHLVLMAIDYN